MLRTVVAATLLTVFVVAGYTARAVDPADKCEAIKLKTAGKYILCRLSEEAKAVKKGKSPSFAACDLKFGEKWEKTEAKFATTCPTLSDGTEVQARMTECANEVPGGTPGSTTTTVGSTTTTTATSGTTTTTLSPICTENGNDPQCSYDDPCTDGTCAISGTPCSRSVDCDSGEQCCCHGVCV